MDVLFSKIKILKKQNHEKSVRVAHDFTKTVLLLDIHSSDKEPTITIKEIFKF